MEQSKTEYFKELRSNWQEAKKKSEDPKYKDQFLLLLSQSPNLRISPYSFTFTKISMEQQNLEGMPYIDCKTYKNWQENGFTVKKGEKSKIDGITWIASKKKDEDEENPMLYPKRYRLFHRSQVEAL